MTDLHPEQPSPGELLEAIRELTHVNTCTAMLLIELLDHLNPPAPMTEEELFQDLSAWTYSRVHHGGPPPPRTAREKIIARFYSEEKGES